MLQPKQIPHGESNPSRTRRESRIAVRGKHSWILTAIALMIVGVAGITVFAQQSSVSNIVGHVADSTGAVIAGATVHVVNQATAAERTGVTNSGGDFSIPNLPPATYELRVEKEGFKTTTIPALELLVGKDADESIVLTVEIGRAHV